eukprot:14641646-Alexandrium_andersonii.AAC.1
MALHPALASNAALFARLVTRRTGRPRSIADVSSTLGPPREGALARFKLICNDSPDCGLPDYG